MLVPGPPVDVPLFVTTTRDDADQLISQLRSLGWVAFGEVTAPVDAELAIDPAGVYSLTVSGQVLLPSSPNPAAPPGWWAAVDRLHQHVIVLVLPHGTDLRDQHVGARFKQMLGQLDAAAAMVAVTDGPVVLQEGPQ